MRSLLIMAICAGGRVFKVVANFFLSAAIFRDKVLHLHCLYAVYTAKKLISAEAFKMITAWRGAFYGKNMESETWVESSVLVWEKLLKTSSRHT